MDNLRVAHLRGRLGEVDRTGPTLAIRVRVGPNVREVLEDRSGLALQQLEAGAENPSLELRLARRAERASKLERHGERARRPEPLGMGPDQADGGGGDPLVLEVV